MKHHPSLFAEFLNACFLVAFVFGTLLAVHWNAARRWWVQFGEALKDVREDA